MRINCLSCGFKVELDDVYDDYEGEIKCFACGASLDLFTVDGNIRSLKLAPGSGALAAEHPARVVKRAAPRKRAAKPAGEEGGPRPAYT